MSPLKRLVSTLPLTPSTRPVELVCQKVQSSHWLGRSGQGVVGVLRHPEGVGVELGGGDVVLPKILARVDHGSNARAALDALDPLSDLVHDDGAALVVGVLDVDDGREVAGLELAHAVHQEVCLGDGVLAGAEELIHAAQDAVLARLAPVGVEVLVAVARPVRDTDDGVLDAVVGDGPPVDVALPLRDVDARDGGAVGADAGLLLDLAPVAALGLGLNAARPERRRARHRAQPRGLGVHGAVLVSPLRSSSRVPSPRALWTGMMAVLA
jgi:hypothetical protein